MIKKMSITSKRLKAQAQADFNGDPAQKQVGLSFFLSLDSAILES